jgi:hypothetical protein
METSKWQQPVRIKRKIWRTAPAPPVARKKDSAVSAWRITAPKDRFLAVSFLKRAKRFMTGRQQRFVATAEDAEGLNNY